MMVKSSPNAGRSNRTIVKVCSNLERLVTYFSFSEGNALTLSSVGDSVPVDEFPVVVVTPIVLTVAIVVGYSFLCNCTVWLP